VVRPVRGLMRVARMHGGGTRWVGSGRDGRRSTYEARAHGSSRKPNTVHTSGSRPGRHGLKPAAGTATSPALGSRSSPGGASTPWALRARGSRSHGLSRGAALRDARRGDDLLRCRLRDQREQRQDGK
jgi:hypothetical protein